MTGQELAAVVSACGAIVATVLAFFQYSHNKKVDLKYELKLQGEKRRQKEENERIGQVYGMMWDKLHEIGFDRLYVIRPHPERKHEFLSVQMEVKKNGIASIKKNVQNVAMEDVPKFAGILSRERHVVYSRVDRQLEDKVARSIFLINGSVSVVIRRLEDEQGTWKGNLVGSSTRERDFSSKRVEDSMRTLAENIQFIIPDFDT